MKELPFQNTVRTERIGGIDIRYQPNGIGVLQAYRELPDYVPMGEFAFSDDRLFTAGVATCVAIVAKKGKIWGLYHDPVYLKSKNWIFESHRERFVKFLTTVRNLDGDESSDYAFLFGANIKLSKEVMMSRLEAEKSLNEIAGFKKERIISRWNDGESAAAVDIMVNPLNSQIYVEYV